MTEMVSSRPLTGGMSEAGPPFWRFDTTGAQALSWAETAVHMLDGNSNGTCDDKRHGSFPVLPIRTYEVGTSPTY